MTEDHGSDDGAAPRPQLSEQVRSARANAGPTITLPDSVAHRVSPPQPTALILGTIQGGQLLPTLARLGCLPVMVTPANALDLATESGTFGFLLLGPDAVGGEDSIYLICDLQALSPASKMLLIGMPTELTTGVLVDAMRAGVNDVVDPTDAIAMRTTIDKLMQSAAARAERVLAIGAHPDDVEIGCAGTLLEHRRHGDSVSILTMSHGAVGGDQGARVLESSAAAEAMGARLMLADLPDARIDAGVDTIRLIEDVVRAIDPTIIYVHSKNDHHQDHRAVHGAVVSASRGVPRVFAYQSPSATNDFAPTIFMAIDDVVGTKVDVLKLFESQSARAYLEPEMVVAGARYWARNLAPRAKYAEPFEVIRSLQAPEPRTPTKSTAAQRVAPVATLHEGWKVGA